MSKASTAVIRRIISELTDEELTTSLKYHLEKGKGLIPENVHLMILEVLKRWYIRMPGE